MNLKKPKFWSQKKPNFISILLTPFTIPIILRNFFFQFLKHKKKLNLKTICVGNIYIGGTGKTPLSIKLYQILKDLRLKVETVKKDYFNQIDEQLLLKKYTLCNIVKSRKYAVKKGLDKKLQFLIFDDGLQDSTLDYDKKLVCFKTRDWIGNGQLLPAGPLREKISSLKKYDMVFLNGQSKNIKSIKKQIRKINSKIKIFITYYKVINLRNYDRNSKYLIFSGIGNPSDFRKILLEYKFNIAKEIEFPDHYNYSNEDFEEIINNAKKNNLKIITTEKDFMKVPNKFKKNINFLEIKLIIKNQNKLITLLND